MEWRRQEREEDDDDDDDEKKGSGKELHTTTKTQLKRARNHTEKSKANER